MSKESTGHWPSALPGLTFLPCQTNALNYRLHISIWMSPRPLKLLLDGALQPSCSTSFSSWAYSSSKGTATQVASRVRNRKSSKALPSALCPLPNPHHSALSWVSASIPMILPQGRASTCSLPMPSPYIHCHAVQSAPSTCKCRHISGHALT